MTLYKIGLCVHLQRGQIIAILEGREPKYSDGELLLQLHKLTVHTSIPRTMSLAIA